MSNLNGAVKLAMSTPFVDKGRKEGVGFDCWGLVHYVANIGLGLEFPDFQIGATKSNHIYLQFLHQIEKNYYPIQKEDLKAGDVVAINMLIHAPSIVQHFGIMVDNKKFIHTLQKQGPQLTSITDVAYKNRIRGFYRWNPNK